MASENQKPQAGEEESTWGGDFNPFADPEERRVLFAAFDSFRYAVGRQSIPTHICFCLYLLDRIETSLHTITLANPLTDNFGGLRI